MSDAVDLEIVRIAEEMERQLKSRAALGRLLGLDSSQVTRIFKGQRRLQRHEYNRVMEWLNIATPPAGVQGGAIVGMPGMVPLYGWVGAASESRLTLAEQNLRGYVPMHPNQAHVKDAFALEVADVSMVPRYEPGEIVYLAPNRWPTRNQDCVIVTSDAHGFLKRYLKRDEDNVYAFQLNPERELTYPIAQIANVHTVVGRG